MFFIVLAAYLFCLAVSVLNRSEGLRAGCLLSVLTLHILVAMIPTFAWISVYGFLPGLLMGLVGLGLSLLVAQGLRLAIREIARALKDEGKN